MVVSIAKRRKVERDTIKEFRKRGKKIIFYIDALMIKFAVQT